MKRLIVDNSNTRTKFALVSSEGMEGLRVMKTADITIASVQTLLEGWQYESVGLCSVVPQAAASIVEACKDAEVCLLTTHLPLAVDFSGYAGLETLGADRIANALAAAQRGGKAVVAVDLGTATTFDVIIYQEGRMRFLGGVIAPGLSLYAGCLHGKTALLPEPADAWSGAVIGRTTQEAMQSAVRVGYPAMVDGVLDAIEQELDEALHVVLTGGDASRIAPCLRRRCAVEPMLTLQGIALAFGMHV